MIKTIASVLFSITTVVGIGATAHADDPGWGAPVVNATDPTPTPTTDDPGWG